MNTVGNKPQNDWRFASTPWKNESTKIIQSEIKRGKRNIEMKPLTEKDNCLNSFLNSTQYLFI